MKNGYLKKKIFDFPTKTRMIAVTNDGNVSATASVWHDAAISGITRDLRLFENGKTYFIIIL